MKVLLDHNLAKEMRLLLPGHLVLTARQMGWDTLANGRLIRSAEVAGFEVMVTSDGKMYGQQNHSQRKIAIVLLTNAKMVNLMPIMDRIVAEIDRSFAGSYAIVEVPLPPKRPRPGPNV